MRLMLCAALRLVPLTLPLSTFAGEPAIDAGTALHPKAVSTGVAPVRILQQPQAIYIPPDDFTYGLPALERFCLKLEVDREGRANSVEIVTSDDPLLNDSVVTAVRHMRWRPAQLDHHSIPATVNLTVLLHN